MASSFQFGDYEVKELLGGGTFGTVFRVLRLDNARERALKQIKLTPIIDDARELKIARDEVEMMKKLPDHGNIVKLYNSCEGEGFILSKFSVICDTTQCLYLELEYCPGGTLQRQISLAIKERKLFSEQLIMDWFLQLANGLSFIHDHGIVHRDIKPLNIFLSKDHSTLKFGDFGISKSAKTYNVRGTPPYMAPEVFRSDLAQGVASSYVPDTKEDVWSLGVILFELVALKVPYYSTCVASLLRCIDAGRRAPLPSDHYSNDIRRLIDWLLTVDPNDRPSMKEVVGNHFVKTGQKVQQSASPHQIPGGELLANLREKNANLQKELESLRSINAQIASELAKREEENAMLFQQVENLTGCLSNADRELSSREEKNATQLEEIECLKFKLQEATNDMDDMRAKINSLRNELQENSEQNFSDMEEILAENELLRKQLQEATSAQLDPSKDEVICQPSNSSYMSTLQEADEEGYIDDEDNIEEEEEEGFENQLKQPQTCSPTLCTCEDAEAGSPVIPPARRSSLPANCEMAISCQSVNHDDSSTPQEEAQEPRPGKDAVSSNIDSEDWFLAVNNGDLDLLKILLEEGADCNMKKPNSNDTTTALHLSTWKVNVQMTAFLLDNGARIDEKNGKGQTPLIIAAANGNEQMMKLLIERGADCQAKHPGCYEYTALHYCGYWGFPETADLLLQRGSQVDEPDRNGSTPLMAACCFGSKTVCQVVLEHGADVNAVDKYGYTALIWATIYRNTEIVQMLAELPQFNRLKHKDNKGKTALQYAINKKLVQIIEILKRKAGH